MADILKREDTGMGWELWRNSDTTSQPKLKSNLRRILPPRHRRCAIQFQCQCSIVHVRCANTRKINLGTVHFPLIQFEIATHISAVSATTLTMSCVLFCSIVVCSEASDIHGEKKKKLKLKSAMCRSRLQIVTNLIHANENCWAWIN